MGKREGNLIGLMELVPALLRHMEDSSRLARPEFFRLLAGELKIAPPSLRRSWLRWSQVSGEVDGKGTLAHSDTLSRLIAAAPAEWLAGAEGKGFGPLLHVLRVRQLRVEAETQRAIRKRLGHLDDYLRSVLKECQQTSFDIVSWAENICAIVDTLVARELRAATLGVRQGSPAEVRLREELLAGTVSTSVGKVISATASNLSALLAEIEALEQMEKQAFRLPQATNSEEDADSTHKITLPLRSRSVPK